MCKNNSKEEKSNNKKLDESPELLLNKVDYLSVGLNDKSVTEDYIKDGYTIASKPEYQFPIDTSVAKSGTTLSLIDNGQDADILNINNNDTNYANPHLVLKETEDSICNCSPTELRQINNTFIDAYKGVTFLGQEAEKICSADSLVSMHKSMTELGNAVNSSAFSALSRVTDQVNSLGIGTMLEQAKEMSLTLSKAVEPIQSFGTKFNSILANTNYLEPLNDEFTEQDALAIPNIVDIGTISSHSIISLPKNNVVEVYEKVEVIEDIIYDLKDSVAFLSFQVMVLANYINKKETVDLNKITYNNGVLKISGKDIDIPLNTNQDDLCKFLFANISSMKKLWDFDEILEEWDYITENNNDERRSSLYSAGRDVNEKIQMETGIKKFFDVTTKTIQVNPIYRD